MQQIIIIKKVVALSIAALLSAKEQVNLTIEEVKPNPIVLETSQIRCTCYLDTGYTASGQWTREGIMAGKKEWIGCVAEVNEINEDGSIGDFIGYYEILDTGYGSATGRGKSKIKKGKSLGTIEAGESVDIWMPTMKDAKSWIREHGDYVYITIYEGEG